MTQTTQMPRDADVEPNRPDEVAYWIDARDGSFPLPWWKVVPLVLLIGAASVAVLTLIMIPVYERQVVDNARDELRAAGIDPSPFAFDPSYRDLDVSGVLPEGVTEADVAAAVERADGLRDLDLDLRPAPEPEPVAEPEEAIEEVVAETAPTTVTAVVTDSDVVLSGEVPDASHRALLIDQASARFDAVTDELTVLDLDATTPGAQDRVLQLARLLGGLPDGAVGTASLTDTSLTSEWTVSSEDDANTIQDTVTAANAAFEAEPGTTASTATIRVEVPEIDQQISDLQDAFDELAVEIRENVTFATNSDVLDETATGTLDEVVALMITYTEPVVEISGHTDNVGDDALNLELSAARAAAVRQYLIDAGIDEDRISSVGKGETEPIDTNDTPEGQANNRRVELVALEAFVE